jgi:hypothetical protein
MWWVPVLGVFVASAAQAQNVIVRVTVTRADYAGCDDGPFDPVPEIYWRVSIDGIERDNRDNFIESNIHPFIDIAVEFSQEVDFTKGTVDISITQLDRDFGGSGEDDVCDISPVGKGINISLDLAACLVSGELAGACGQTLAGTNGFEFHVDVEEPPSAPGLEVRCQHSPIAPQPGDTVTITASALDGALDPRLADAIEIWVDDRTAPRLTALGFSAMTTAGPFTDAFNYGCRVRDDALTVWTGWRKVAVGNADVQDAFDRIPILFTGPRSSRLDFVFYPDRDSYPDGASDPQFLLDVESVVNGAYMGRAVYLQNQDLLNFWIAPQRGRADGFKDGECRLSAPKKRWEDAGVVLHTDAFRDCATDGLFSSEPTSFGTVLHESGHRPFGLADEYCCDGGYFEGLPFPNLRRIGSPVDLFAPCIEDALSVGRDADSCRLFQEEDDGPLWTTSDPAMGDLMVDNGTIQALDLRKMLYLFGVCRGAGC